MNYQRAFMFPGDPRKIVCFAPFVWKDFPANPLISFESDRNFGPVYSHPFALSDTWPIALAGTRVMNRMSVEGTAPVRHAEVACWVMSPKDRALTEAASDNVAPAVGQERRRGTGNRATYNN